MSQFPKAQRALNRQLKRRAKAQIVAPEGSCFMYVSPTVVTLADLEDYQIQTTIKFSPAFRAAEGTFELKGEAGEFTISKDAGEVSLYGDSPLFQALKLKAGQLVTFKYEKVQV